jgi:hypothetical protein
LVCGYWQACGLFKSREKADMEFMEDIGQLRIWPEGNAGCG